jgi:hypothetical protein
VDSLGVDSLQGPKLLSPNFSTGPGVTQLAVLWVQGEEYFFLHVKRPRREIDLVRELKISVAIPPLPYTSFNGEQRDIILILCFWIVSDRITYSVRFKVH